MREGWGGLVENSMRDGATNWYGPDEWSKV